MGFCVCFLQQRKPGLVLVGALRKVQRLGTSLHDCAVLIFRIGAVVNIQKVQGRPYVVAVVGLDEEQLVVDDLGDPFTV